MKCPKCGGKLLVKDSRPAADGSIVKRKRICSVCGEEYFSTESFNDIDKPEEIRLLYEKIEKLEKKLSGKTDRATKSCVDCLYSDECDEDDQINAKKEHYWCWAKGA